MLSLQCPTSTTRQEDHDDTEGAESSSGPDWLLSGFDAVFKNMFDSTDHWYKGILKVLPLEKLTHSP